MDSLSWAVAWLRRTSFALIWGGYLLGAYLVPIWILARLVGFPDGLPHLSTGFGLAATLFVLATMTALTGVAVVARPLMGTWKFLGPRRSRQPYLRSPPTESAW